VTSLIEKVTLSCGAYKKANLEFVILRYAVQARSGVNAADLIETETLSIQNHQ
jgi:hypothetical protein